MWSDAIGKEFTKMNEKVWHKIKREEMQPGRRCFKHKWVFEIKRNGRFRARLVACGYSQIPGVDFEQAYSAVANDVTFRIIIIIMLVWKLSAIIFDVETAFLYGKLDQKIYMECPEGMEHEEDECVQIDRAMYGLAQASHVYYSTYSKIIESFRFKMCPTDPCLFMRQDEDGICIILCYVDDNLVVGNPKAIEKLRKQLDESELTYTVEEKVTDYLSCEIQVAKDGKSAWLGQPHMVNTIEKEFGEEGSVMMRDARDPSLWNCPSCRGRRDSRYKSGVGMLMYLLKHSRPDITNPIREITKVLERCTQAAYKEMPRCIKFVLDTKLKGLKVEPVSEDGKWQLVVYSDSDWAGDKDNRRSVGSYIIFLNNVPIAWRSKLQKTTSLSSSEAEFYACGEAVKEVPFIGEVLMFLGIPLELPVQFMCPPLV
jgi:hypothetical protein